MKISVIICTKDREDDLKKTIQTLIHQTRLPDELIVVDSTNPPIISHYFSSENLPFSIKYENSLPGLPHQRNIGIDLSHGELITFFDDDVLLSPEYFYEIEQVFLNDKNSEIGAVSGRIINYPGSENISWLSKAKQMLYDCYSTIFLLSKLGNGKFRFSGNPTHSHQDNFGHFIECLSGGCTSFRRQIFDHVRFDENMNGYAFMEDTDISKQVLNLGYKAYYCAKAQLIHNVSKTGRIDEKLLYEMIIRNQIYLFEKNWSTSFLRKVAFIWSLLGFFILNFHHKLRRQGMLKAFRYLKD